jgi:hypothetical protein
MSGFEVKKVRIVDSTAKSRSPSSRKRECVEEFDGEEGFDGFVEGREGSWGGVAIDAGGRAR